MKAAAILCILSLLVVSCGGSVVSKQIRVIPVYEEWVVFSAIPKFVERESMERGSNTYNVPKLWSYKSADYGEKIVTWDSRVNRKERLVIVDSGFHPVGVPIGEASVLSGREADRGPSVVVFFEGTNTAFTPDAVELVPISTLPIGMQKRVEATRMAAKQYERDQGR